MGRLVVADRGCDSPLFLRGEAIVGPDGGAAPVREHGPVCPARVSQGAPPGVLAGDPQSAYANGVLADSTQTGSGDSALEGD